MVDSAKVGTVHGLRRTVRDRLRVFETREVSAEGVDFLEMLDFLRAVALVAAFFVAAGFFSAAAPLEAAA